MMHYSSVLNINSLINLYNGGYSMNYLSRAYGVHKDTIRRFLISNGITIRSQKDQAILESRNRVYNSTYFNKINSHEKAYWLGFILADGSLTCNDHYRLSISLKPEDGYHLKKFAGVFSREVGDDRGNPRFDIECKHLWMSLNSIGVIPRKSFNETGKIFDKIQAEYINSFILGFMDGDGSVLLSQIRPNYYIIELSFCGVEILMKKLKSILMNRFDLNDNKIGEHNNSFRIGWRGKQVLPVLEWLYKDSPIRLERKYNIYTNYVSKIKQGKNRGRVK